MSLRSRSESANSSASAARTTRHARKRSSRDGPCTVFCWKAARLLGKDGLEILDDMICTCLSAQEGRFGVGRPLCCSAAYKLIETILDGRRCQDRVARHA